SPKLMQGVNLSGRGPNSNGSSNRGSVQGTPTLARNGSVVVGGGLAGHDDSNNNPLNSSTAAAVTGLDEQSSLAAQEDEMLNLGDMDEEMDMTIGLGNTTSSMDDVYGNNNNNNNNHNSNGSGGAGGVKGQSGGGYGHDEQDQDQPLGLEGLEMDSMINEEDEDDVMNGFLNL
ncbi:hypothetical protein BGZ98_006225, partial [Dissophora globulifera]